MIRYAALLVMAALCTAAGFRMAGKLRERLTLLESFARSLQTLQSEISYAATPLVQAVRSLRELEPFWTGFADALSAGAGAEQAWIEAESAIPAALLGEDTRDELRKLSRRLGKCTRAEETANIARTIEHLRAQIDAAKAEYARKGKLYKGVGVLSGLALVIVLI